MKSHQLVEIGYMDPNISLSSNSDYNF